MDTKDDQLNRTLSEQYSRPSQVMNAPVVHAGSETTNIPAQVHHSKKIRLSINIPMYLVWVIFGLAVVGFILSTYSFLHNHLLASGDICNLGEVFNCDLVNRGPYAKIIGIPVALIGMIGYFFLGAAAFLKRKDPEAKTLTLFLPLSATAGFIFSLYLTFLEAVVIQAWCVVCLMSLLIIMLIMLATFWLRNEVERVHST